MKSTLLRFTLAALASVFCLAQPARAAEQSALDDAYTAAAKVAQHGPAHVVLADQAVLDLPKGYAFVPKAEAARMLDAMGNVPGDDLLGLVLPESDQANWFIDVSFERAGYIKDDDAKDWDASELLTSLKDGTEEGNKQRRERGIAEFEVIGWVEKPAYNAASHQLVWAANIRNKDGKASDEQGVNYNTYALGREGYISMNLVTGMNSVEAEKPEAQQLLAALAFNDGKRYQDFNADTDQVAEYGLAALVAGVGAKKLGLFALLGAFFAKSAKLIALGAVGLFAAAKRFFGNKDA
ncbi:DUF2167 domain-containing protein [Chitinolyticbacter meiyuanensis]|uniref:DUF2167 domain-containing protein n=1 Tax=Chitinolyticbacter meiyuanensis TaxID=682798 RepID=UPI0011E594E8|nr:DUF2167 domain-containing protein [Chitinolyticbacter meiyuanensis]